MKTLKSKYQIQEQKIIIRKVIMKSGKNINKNGECKVYIELISFFPDGRRSTRRISTPVLVSPKHWDSKKWDGTIKKSDSDHERKNGIIDELYYKYCLQLQDRENGTYRESFKAEDMVSLDDMFPKVQKTLLDFIDEYIAKREKISKYNTVKSFRSMRNRLAAYQDDRKVKLTFESLNLSFSDDFQAWMIGKGYIPSTIGKTYTLMITVLRFFNSRADELNIKMTDKFKNENFRRGDTKASNDAHPLSREEFNILLHHKFDSDQLKLTQKRFLLQCTTGMRWSDLFTITPEMVVDGNIIYYPQKTTHKKDNKAIVPLNGISESILKPIGYDSRKLYVSNQKYNDSLSDMFNALNKHYEKKKFDIYTSHDARDTFISFLIEEGIDVPSIMKMVGQSSWLETRRYTKVTEVHMSTSMKKALVFSI